MKIIPFDPQHLISMNIQDNPDGASKMNRKAMVKLGTELMAGNAITITNDDGDIVVCGGIRKICNGVGEVWAVPSETITKYSKTVLMEAKNFIEECKEYHRIQAIVVEGFETAEKLLVRIGFLYESTLRKYGADGKDFKMYAIVR